MCLLEIVLYNYMIEELHCVSVFLFIVLESPIGLVVESEMVLCLSCTYIIVETCRF